MGESPKILSFRVVKESDKLFVDCEFGDKTVRKEIPANESVLRLSALFGKSGFNDTEIVTSKE